MKNVENTILISQLKKQGAVYKGHFLLSSGRHSNRYINKDALYAIPNLFAQVINSFSDILACCEDDDIEYNIITGPAIAGAVLAAPIAVKLNKIFVYSEKAVSNEFVSYPIKNIVNKNIMKFNRGYDKIIEGKKVVIVEDIITTGASVQKTIDAIRLCGGECVVVLAIWNRTRWKPKGIEVISLVNELVESWSSVDCPLCKMGVFLTDPKR